MFPRKTGKHYPQHRRSKTRSLLTRTWLIALVISSLALASVYVALAAISLSTSVPYAQNFDGMGIPAANPAPSSLPANFRVDTIAAPRTLGSFFSGSAGTARVGGANMPTNAANGSYNLGAGTAPLGDADRAVGFISSATSTQSGNLYAELQNNTGGPLSGLQLSYDVEKYRNGSNPAGFRIQLYYSPDGLAWTDAGPDFLTSFKSDADNNGFATAPGEVVSVTAKTLGVSVANGGVLYLAWNYSVATGTTTSNAQALGIDNISIVGNAAVSPTNPSGVGSATPSTVAPTGSTLLTVAVTPGANPTSTAHNVSADLTVIGGSASQSFFDDGTNGDVTPGDNTFSFNATVASGTSGGAKNLPFTITETAPMSRTGNGSISLTVLSSTSPSGLGAANPNSILAGEASTLTVNVSPGANPPSSGLFVSADLTTIGLAAAQQFFDDGVNGGDALAGDNVFTYIANAPIGTTPGAKSLGFTVSDGQGRSSAGSISLTIQQPPPPVDHLVISQLYGGGGNSGATFTNDYVELYNPTGISFNLAGWSLQYASATGSSWTNTQPLGGTIAPGEYFLVGLASGGANGAALPVSPNIQGGINMSATTGKIALVSNSINLSGTCPNGVDPDIVDFVGYGTSAGCFEGANRAPAASNTSALFRKVNGTQDTNQNGVDFQTGTPNPRRTAPIVELGPWVAGSEPITDGTNAPYDATITVDFSEAVDVVGNWYDISCTNSGQHNSATVASYNSFKGYHITPNAGFEFGEQCTVTILHTQVNDQDADDSNPNTDTLFADYSWTFTVVAAGVSPYPPSVHLTFGNPSNAVADLLQANNYLMEKPSFALSYNRDTGTPNWVSWHLDDQWTGTLPRVDTYRADPAVPADWYRAQSTDYFASGFDRGHMTPNADRDNTASITLNQETFLMSNMVPQAPDNNQGPWADFENHLRTLLNTNEVYIVAGPHGVGGFGDNGFRTALANGHITVPSQTWKVALVLPKGSNDLSRVDAATTTIAVIMPNSNGLNSDWHSYLTTVDAVEALTGYDFFANVPDAVENAIEAGNNGNNPPGTENQFATTAEDGATPITLNAVSPLANPSFTFTIVNQPNHGQLLGSGPSFTYTPAQDFNGSDSFTFKVNDGSHDSNTSTVTITVTEVNDSPSATDDNVSGNEDSDLDLPAANLTANDSAGPDDESIQTLTVTNVFATANTHGTVSLHTGIVTYLADPNFSGTASFQYQVCDNGTSNGVPDTKCAVGTVNVTVNAANDDPVAVNDSASTGEDTPVTIDVVANDTDADGNLLSLVSVGTAGHGSVAILNGMAQYTPAPNFNGLDRFNYEVSDGHGGGAIARVNVTVNPVNDNPVAVNDSASTNEDNSVNINVVANDTDVEGNALSLLSVGTAGHGSVAILNGMAQYTPAPDFNGSDSFSYVVSDGQGGQSSATVNVTVNPVNDAPTANSQSVTTNSNTAVAITLTGSDLETASANLTFEVSVSPAHGTLSGTGANVNYHPANNFSGQDSFKFKVRDAGDGASAPLTSAEATVSITVNDTIAPTITAPANITLNTGAGASLCGLLISDATLGTATASDNAGGVSISRSGVPAGNIFPVGTTTITYTATDDAGNTSSATQTVKVIDNTAPTVTAPAGTTVNANSSCHAVIPNVVPATTASDNCGSVTVTQSPAAGTSVGLGTQTITLTATDSAGNSATATTTFTVVDTTPPTVTAPPPTSVPANGSGQAAIPNVLPQVVASDSCSGVTLQQSPTAGTLVGVGTHTITITATDGAGNSSTANTTFTVTANNGGSLTFSLSITPSTVKRGKMAKLLASYNNGTGQVQQVTFKVRYNSPCGSANIGDIGPIKIKAGAHGDAQLPFHVPRSACLGVYTLTLESYVGGILIGSTTAELTVIP